ncbi:MAG TPA: DinB family protein [Pyrinomonadaceae bacterium]|jgi:hypothetical protein
MSNHFSVRPEAGEYGSYFEGYVSLVPEGDVVETLARQIEETLGLLRSLPESRGGERYEPGKWSIRELLGHMSDTERVFAYRALCIARGDTAPLPGMDQDVYVAGANFDARTLADLTDEFEQVRRATLALFRPMDETAWLRRGTANNNPFSVRALAHVCAGHELHHLRVLRDRYLNE